MPLLKPVSVRTPLPHISASPLQRGVPPLQPLAVHYPPPPPPPLSVFLQGLGVPPLLTPAVRAYKLIQSFSQLCRIRRKFFPTTHLAQVFIFVLLHEG